MNDHILKFFGVLALSLPLVQAWSSSDSAPCSCNTTTVRDPFSIEAQAAAFFPLGSTMRRVYGTALPLFTLEGNWRFHKSWDIWLDVSYVFGNGHSIGNNHNSTHLSFIPLSAGIKYLYQVGKSIDLYVGVGPCYSFLHTLDRSAYVHRHTSASNFGAIVKTGTVYYFANRWFIDGFFNYMYQRIFFHQSESEPVVYRDSANLSSLQLGAGIGIKF